MTVVDIIFGKSDIYVKGPAQQSLDLWESKSDKEISDRYCVVALSDGGSYQSVNPSHMGRIVHCV